MIFLFLLFAKAAFTEASEATLSVSTDSSGNFSVNLNGKLWLSGGETRVFGYSSSDGTLKLLSQVSCNELIYPTYYPLWITNIVDTNIQPNKNFLIISLQGVYSGSDPLGTYQANMFQWGDDPCLNISCPQHLMQTEIRTYESDPGALVFVQSFPQYFGPDEHTTTAANVRSGDNTG